MKRIRTIIIAVMSAAVLAGVGLFFTAGSASARSNAPAGVSYATTNPVPTLNMGESAQFRVIDTGSSIIVIGTAGGMVRNTGYVSLLYPDSKCSTPEPTATFTVGGAWQARGDKSESLYEQYDGQAYKAVRGNIGSVSIRAVTAAVNSGGGNFTATLQARACAPLSSQR